MADYNANDKLAAIDIAYKLSYALDAMDKSSMLKLFPQNKNFTFDISTILDRPEQKITGSDYHDIAVNALGGFHATQHTLSSPIVTLGDETAHIKTMIIAYHALMKDGLLESTTIRALWLFDLKRIDGQHYISRFEVKSLMPIDRPDIWQEGLQRVQDGRLRDGLIRT